MAHAPTEAPAPTRIVGTRVRRVDAVDKVAGVTRFGSDVVQLPGMLHAKVLLAERPHAVIKRLDMSRALELKGVRATLTGHEFRGGLMGFQAIDQAAMAADRVRYYGEIIAAVAADSEQIAEEALERIEVEYEDLPYVLDPDEAQRPGAIEIHPEKRQYQVLGGGRLSYDGNLISVLRVGCGDVEAALKSAYRVYDHTYRTQVAHHGYIEPHVAVAHWDVLNDRVTIWTPSQGPYMLRGKLASVLRLPESRIRVIGTYVGGGFGGKVDAHMEPVCALLSRKTGRPVKAVVSREVDFLSTFTRGETVMRIKTGIDREGTMMVRDAWILLGTGAYVGLGPLETTSIVQGIAGPYRIPNARIEGYCVYTNKQNSQMVRGPGGAQAAFAGETQIDLIARDLGIDPVEYRRRHAIRTGDKNYLGFEVHHAAFLEALDAATRRFGWTQAYERGAGRLRRGRGLAAAEWHSGQGGSAAYVKLGGDGTAQVLTGANEIGGGEATVIALLVAEQLGLAVEDVTVNGVDTDISPYDPVVAGSRSTHTTGLAVQAAALQVRGQVLDIAARQLEASPDDLVIENKQIFVRGAPDRGLPLARVAAMAAMAGGPIQGSGAVNVQGLPCDPTYVQEGQVGGTQSHTYAVQCAEVEVDIETGQVAITRLVASNDVGRAINPTGVEGQIEGGAAMGIGYALFEEMRYDDQGRLLNPNLLDYKMVTALDTPRIEPVVVEVFDPYGGPHGAKGVGEPPILPTAPAIANAIFDATGVMLRELPMTPERLRAGLKGGGAGAPARDQRP